MELLNTYQVAKMLGVGETTIKRWRDSGKLAYVELGEKIIRYEPEAIENLINEGRKNK